MDDFGAAVVAEAREWIGTPFHWEQSCKGAGCDCKGLIAGVARNLGRPEALSVEADWRGYVSRVPAERLRDGLERLFDRCDVPAPGDVLLLAVRGKAQHIAFYAGDGRMIHTYSVGPKCVIEVPLGRFWNAALAGIYRWKPHGC